jgi:hypothetical protein
MDAKQSKIPKTWADSKTDGALLNIFYPPEFYA